MRTRLSPIRRFLLWWMRHPNSPFVSANFAVDFSDARAYLERLNAGDGPRVTVNHLFTAAVGRTYAAFPAANARVLGNTIRREAHVGIAAPVALEGEGRELSMMLLTGVEALSLREVAQRTRGTVAREREGKVQDPLARLMIAAATHMPDRVMHTSFSLTWNLLSQPALGSITGRLLPVTVGITNPGAAFSELEGVYFRGGSLSLPGPGWSVGSIFGLTPVQDEVIVVDGAPAVRPMLPVMFVFDHRLFDGVMASRIGAHLAGILRDPSASFGPDGQSRL